MNDEALTTIQWQLQGMYGMAMGIATYSVGTDSTISGDSCTSECESANFKIENIKWTSYDSIADAEGELVELGPAPTLTSGDCYEGCTECVASYWSNDIYKTPSFQCNDETVFRYTNPCDATTDSTSKCMTDDDQLCFISYPYGDYYGVDSALAACRTVPTSYQTGTWKFGNKDCFADNM